VLEPPSPLERGITPSPVLVILSEKGHCMRYVFGLAALAVVLVVLLFAFDPAYQDMRADRAYYESRSQALALEERELKLRERENISPVVTSAAAGYYVLGAAGALAVLAVGLHSYYMRRVPLVAPDRRGLLPVARATIERDEITQIVAAALAAYHRTQLVAAASQPQPVPHTFNYAPKLDGRGAAAPAADSAVIDAPALPAVAPGFAEMLSSGLVGPGRPLVLGYAAGAPLVGSFKDIYSSAIGGLPSSGKTTTIRFLASQAALLGARFVLVDHHHEKEDGLANTLAPLRSAFLCAPARNNAETLQALALVDEMFQSRKSGGSPDRSPVLLCVDEFSALMRSPIGGECAEIIEQLNQEGRGFGMFGLYSGQVWLSSRSGGSELRYSLASSFVHRMHRRQAALLLPDGEGVKVERLDTGSCMLWRPSGEVVQVQIPNTTAADVERVAALLRKPDGSLMVAKPEQATTALQSAETLSPDAARAAGLFLAGKSPADIVLELRGVKTSEGRRYQSALDEVLTLLRLGLGGVR